MKRKVLLGRLATCCALSITTAAHADPLFGDDRDPTEDSATSGKPKTFIERVRPGFGARVGGYGFRDETGESAEWNDCRMNGFGIFGTADATPHVFGELSVDFYNATPDVVESGMDRTSTHALASLGLRMFPEFVITPYIQLGGGAEWTRVNMTEHGRQEGVYPMGFIGIGTELNVTRELKLGANLRMLATAHPRHSHAQPSVAAAGLSQARQGLNDAGQHERMEMELGVAAQGQFFLRYAL